MTGRQLEMAYWACLTKDDRSHCPCRSGRDCPISRKLAHYRKWAIIVSEFVFRYTERRLGQVG